MVSRLIKNMDIIVVSLCVTLLSGFGKIFTQQGLSWYHTLNTPTIMPPDYVFGIVWTILYTLSACAVIILIRSYKHTMYWRWIIALFGINAFLSLAWSYLFFIHRSIDGALIDCIVMEFNLITVCMLLWSDARRIALLLLPNVLWVAFALYLNYQMLLLN